MFQKNHLRSTNEFFFRHQPDSSLDNNMFHFKKEIITPEIAKYKITANEKPLTYRNWITYLKTSIDFTDFFVNLLKSSDHNSMSKQKNRKIRRSLYDSKYLKYLLGA